METMHEYLTRVAASGEVEAGHRAALRGFDGSFGEIAADVELDEDAAAAAQWFIDQGLVSEDDQRDEQGEQFDDALEIKVRGSRSLGDSGWSIDGIEIVVSLGGPTVWFETDGCGASLHGSWGGESAVLHCLGDELAAAVCDVYETAMGCAEF